MILPQVVQETAAHNKHHPLCEGIAELTEQWRYENYTLKSMF